MLFMKLHHLPYWVEVKAATEFAGAAQQGGKSLSNYQRRARGGCGKPGCLKAGHGPFDSSTAITLRYRAPIRRM
jgi:hypothetical protein